MNIKIIFAILSVIIGTYSFFPYIRDIFRKKTQPHAYTWLIWSITQGTAVYGMWYGGGGIGAIELTIGVMLVFFVFLLSFKYGTKNIRKIDTACLIASIVAVVVWWQFKNPALSIFMVCAIDFIGFIPSFRKSFVEPWSETLISWATFTIGNFFAILALQEYNFLTMSYLLTISAGNAIIFAICITRRRFVLKPIIQK